MDHPLRDEVQGNVTDAGRCSHTNSSETKMLDETVGMLQVSSFHVEQTQADKIDIQSQSSLLTILEVSTSNATSLVSFSDSDSSRLPKREDSLLDRNEEAKREKIHSVHRSCSNNGHESEEKLEPSYRESQELAETHKIPLLMDKADLTESIVMPKKPPKKGNSVESFKPQKSSSSRISVSTSPTVSHSNVNRHEKKSEFLPTSSPSSRKGYTSLSQFLVLTFPERSKPTKNHVYQKKYPKNPFLKERFVHANFRFVIRNAKNYTGTLLDPDMSVDWNDVAYVLVTITPDTIICPICLMRPMAAKMTKCGHIFCWACMLHYLELEKQKWRRCPVCYESVYGIDLKGVRFIKVSSLEEGLPIQMKLMQRLKTSTLVSPFQFNLTKTSDTIPSEVEPTAFIYAKFLATDIDCMREQIQQERIELEIQMRLANKLREKEDVPFIEMALHRWNEQCDIFFRETGQVVPEVFLDLPTDFMELSALREEPELWMTLQKSKSEDCGDKLSKCLTINSDGSSCDPIPEIQTDPSHMYYFHQGFDGQLVFLHPINVKMLHKEYGLFHLFPRTIVAPILELERRTQTEDIRHRNRCLAHLPIGCDYHLCEIDLSGFVSEQTMKLFSTELKRRRKKRDDRFKSEPENKLIPNLPDFILEDHQFQSGIHPHIDPSLEPQESRQLLVEDAEPKKTGNSYAHAVSGTISNSPEAFPFLQTSNNDELGPSKDQNSDKFISSPINILASPGSPSKFSKTPKNRNLLLSTSSLLGHYR